MILKNHDIFRYFAAQQTKRTRIATIAKYDQTGSEPSPFLLRPLGFRESIASRRAFFDLRDAIVSFWLGGITLFPCPTA